MKKLIITSLVMLFMAGCGGNGQKKNTEQNVPATKQAEITAEPILTPPDSGAIRLTLTDGEARIKVHKKADQTILVEFGSEGHQKLSAQLFPADSMANVRFSQIFLPDGTMDGPFGRSIAYDLKEKGVYRLSIHESLMAGDPWSGDLTVEVKLED